MRKLQIMTVFDARAEAFMPAFSVDTVGIAMREFEKMCNSPGHQFCDHAEDFSLFLVGEFDVERGVVLAKDAPIVMATAIATKKVGKPQIAAEA